MVSLAMLQRYLLALAHEAFMILILINLHALICSIAILNLILVS